MKLTLLYIFLIFSTSASWGQDSILPPPPIESFPLIQPEIICWCSSDARFPGGYEAMQEWFTYHGYHYRASIQVDSPATVYIQFVVEKNGSITNIKINKGATLFLDCAAEELIRSMPKWEPAIYAGERIQEIVRIPISFELI